MYGVWPYVNGMGGWLLSDSPNSSLPGWRCKEPQRPAKPLAGAAQGFSYFRYAPPLSLACRLWPGGMVIHCQPSFVSSRERYTTWPTW